jgi:hypothetical protein
VGSQLRGGEEGPGGQPPSYGVMRRVAGVGSRRSASQLVAPCGAPATIATDSAPSRASKACGSTRVIGVSKRGPRAAPRAAGGASSPSAGKSTRTTGVNGTVYNPSGGGAVCSSVDGGGAATLRRSRRRASTKADEESELSARYTTCQRRIAQDSQLHGMVRREGGRLHGMVRREARSPCATERSERVGVRVRVGVGVRVRSPCAAERSERVGVRVRVGVGVRVRSPCATERSERVRTETRTERVLHERGSTLCGTCARGWERGRWGRVRCERPRCERGRWERGRGV